MHNAQTLIVLFTLHNVITIGVGTAAIGPDNSKEETGIPSNNGLML